MGETSDAPLNPHLKGSELTALIRLYPVFRWAAAKPSLPASAWLNPTQDKSASVAGAMYWPLSQNEQGGEGINLYLIKFQFIWWTIRWIRNAVELKDYQLTKQGPEFIDVPPKTGWQFAMKMTWQAIILSC